MKARLNSLRSQITDTPPVSKEVRGPLPPIFYARQSRLATQEIFDDLLKKIIGLSVVIETERGQTYGPYIDIIEHPRVPMWSFSPNKIHISLIGTAVGLLLGLAYSAVLELKSLSDISPAEAERFLEVSFLGELPRLQHHDA
jgi:hypothetical protein